MENKKILIIEDNQNTRKLYADLLHSRGYSVEIAVDGPGGLEMARSGKFHLILLDIMLPGIDGLEVLETLKNEDATRKIAVFTNLSAQNLFEEAKKKGADDFIIKSDTAPEAFLEKIKTLTS